MVESDQWPTEEKCRPLSYIYNITVLGGVPGISFARGGGLKLPSS